MVVRRDGSVEKGDVWKMRKFGLVISMAGLVAMAGCTDSQEINAATGALAGAAVGSQFGAGKGSTAAALLGAAAGAAVGANAPRN